MRHLNQFITIIILVFLLTHVSAQEYRESIEKEFKFNNVGGGNVLQINNIKGFIKIEAHNSDMVMIQVDRHIQADSESEIQRALEELSLEFIEKEDSIISFLNAPFIKRQSGDKHQQIWMDDRVPYRFTHNFTIKVPKHTNLLIRNILGNIEVIKLETNSIIATTVNGWINLEDITADVEAKTVNGNVRSTFRQNQFRTVKLATVNGNVDFYYPNNLSAMLHITSKRGTLESDLHQIPNLSSEYIHLRPKSFSRTFQLGDGEATILLKTVNGGITIKKNN